MNTILINRKNSFILLTWFAVIIVLSYIILNNVKEAFRNENNTQKFHDKAQDHLINAFEKMNVNLLEFSNSVPYGNPDSSLNDFYNNLQRLVHLDLKGAPPKSSKYKELFPLFRKLGATGVLIEWEDMFPYEDDVADIAAKNAYSVKEIVQILKWANANELQVIPLVQTFGHLEFVLKLEKFSHLRELSDSPLSLSPTTDDVYTVLFSMLEQILKLHFDTKYIHFGCDEVYGLGSGKSGKFMREQKLDKDGLFFKHVIKLANHIKSIRPDVKPIIWDDMLRHIPEGKLLKSGLGKLVEPMVWKYVPDLGNFKSPLMWRKYGKVFKSVWTASSFKGATGAAQYITNALYHIRNHISWAEILKKFGSGNNSIVQFEGIALTGWQRYDHFASLCELLPAAIHSLGLCLQTIKYGAFTKGIHKDVGKILKCERPLTLDLRVDSKQVCNFTGFPVYRGILMFHSLEHISNNYHINGYLNSYHIKHNFSSPWHLKSVRNIVTSKYNGFKSVEKYMKSALEDMYDKYTVDEWLESFLGDSVQKYELLYNSFRKIMTRKHFPRRPLSLRN